MGEFNPSKPTRRTTETSPANVEGSNRLPACFSRKNAAYTALLAKRGKHEAPALCNADQLRSAPLHEESLPEGQKSLRFRARIHTGTTKRVFLRHRIIGFRVRDKWQGPLLTGM